jgi:hypothetical protein
MTYRYSQGSASSGDRVPYKKVPVVAIPAPIVRIKVKKSITKIAPQAIQRRPGGNRKTTDQVA